MRLPTLDGRRFRFSCTQCGACCRRRGVVWLKKGESARLARHLHLTAAVFRARYVTRLDDGRELLEVPGEDRGCPLLDGDLCSVDPVKPDQCRAYPFWREIVESPAYWRAERRECEGIGQGPVADPAHVRRMMAIDPGEDGPPPPRRRA